MTISPIDRRTCISLWVTLSITFESVSAQQIIPFNLIQIATSYDTLDDGSIDTATSTPHVFIFGSTQLSSSEEVFSSVSASGKFQAMILPLDRFGFTVAYNAFGVNPNTIAKDSLDVPSLVFPDAGNTGFIVSAFYTKFIGKKEQIPKQSLTRLTHYVEFSLRNTKLNTSYRPDYRNEIEEDTLDEYNDDEYYDDEETTTDETLNFTSRNLNIGTRLDWLYASKSDPTQVVQTGVCIYINYFSVPREDAKSFMEAINKTYDESISTTIKSLGVKTSFAYKGCTVFGDFRWNLFSKFDVANTALDGFMFNIGTALNVELLKF